MAEPEYEKLRLSYKPTIINWLFIAESPPPPAGTVSTRHFYRTGVGTGDRLFANTIKALYAEASSLSEAELAEQKETWLRRFQQDGCYMIECLDESLAHGTTPTERKQKIKAALPQLIAKVQELATPQTQIILIKSNPYNIATNPLKEAGFKVINQALIDYPGYWREEPYRQKLAETIKNHGWS